MAQLNIKTGTITRRPLELPTSQRWLEIYSWLNQQMLLIRGRYGHKISLKIMLPCFLEGHYLQWMRSRHDAHFYNATREELDRIQGVTISWDSPTLEAWVYDVLVIPGYDGMDLVRRLPIWSNMQMGADRMLAVLDKATEVVQDHQKETTGGATLVQALKEVREELVEKYLGAC